MQASKAAMAGSEGSCYEGKGCGVSRLGDARGRDFPGRTGGTERKKNCHDHLPLSSLLRNTLGSVRLRSDGAPVAP
jgi:hypothetical protein